METRPFSDLDLPIPPDHEPVAEQQLLGDEPRVAVKPPDYSIAAVSKLTGISCHTLRVWERRYNFPVPLRSPSGHRRYDRNQVQILCHLTHLNRVRRQPIGELIAQWHAGALDAHDHATSAEAPTEDEMSTRLVGRLLVGDDNAAEREYEALASRLDLPTLLERVICPAMVEAGDGWFRRCHSIYQERLTTVFLRRKLNGLIEVASRANTQPVHSVIIGTVQGDRHEGGVMFFTLAMVLRGWRVHDLGVDLPVREFLLAAQQLHASAIALSFILSRNIKKRFQELEKLCSIPVFVGGRSIVNYQSLARSHGLIPLVGPINKTADLFESEFRHWRCAHDCGR
jgi:methanogenic corrinoid protein MtbC1